MGSSVSFHHSPHLTYLPETLFEPQDFLERCASCHDVGDNEVVVVVAAPGRRSCHVSAGGRKVHLESTFLCQGSTSWSLKLKTFWCLGSICVWYLGNKCQTGFQPESSESVPEKQT